MKIYNTCYKDNLRNLTIIKSKDWLREIKSILVLMTLVAIVFNSCKKEDNSPRDKTTAIFNPYIAYGTMTDQDSNVYKTVTIGTQIWMAENLRTTKYNDGTPIPNVKDVADWSRDLTTGAYCSYNNTKKKDSIATLGLLYNWYAVNTGKLAPKGWHVPTDAEWATLTTYLGGDSVAGDKMKEAGTMHWKDFRNYTANESGFTALPSGFRTCIFGLFDEMSVFCGFWSSTAINGYNPYVCTLISERAYCSRYPTNRFDGYSVRCLKD